MNKRCKFTVDYGSKFTARFREDYHAQRFAWEMSRSHGSAEVLSSAGLIGQWRFGDPTEEFRHLRAMHFMPNAI